MANRRHLFGEGLPRLALSLATALVLGICPALVLADEVEVEPEGHGEETVVVQDEGVEEPGEEPVLEAQKADPVTYLDDKGVEQKCASYTLVTNSTQDVTLNEGWYVVVGDVSITGKVIAARDVRIILSDGARLNIQGHITGNGVAYGSFTVYGQTGSTGRLIINNNGTVPFACECRNLTINGGIMEAIVTCAQSYGIYTYKGDVTINGGTLTASGEWWGINVNGGSVTINGGTVTAVGTEAAVSADKAVNIGAGVSVRAGADETSAADVTSMPYAEWSNEKWVQTSVAVASVTVDPAVATLTVGESQQLTATVKPDGAPEKAITWKSSDEAVAKVDASGRVTAVAPGKATVTATAGGKTGTCEITVRAKEEPAPADVPPVSVTAHVQRRGTLPAVSGGAVAGTTGKSLRLESLRLAVDGATVSGGIEYRGHVQRKGWEKRWARDGAMAGTEGKSHRLEAVQIRLWGDLADKYDVYYRVHTQRYGWMAWAKNGEEAGTQGMSRRAEAIQVVLMEKDAPAPATDFQGATQAYAKAFAKK